MVGGEQEGKQWEMVLRGKTELGYMVFKLSAHTTSTLLLTSTRATWPTDGCRGNRTRSGAALRG